MLMFPGRAEMKTFLAETPASHGMAWPKILFYQSLCLYFLSLRGKKKKEGKKSSQGVGSSAMVCLKFPAQRRGYSFKGSAAQPLEQRGHDSWAPFPPQSPIHFMANWVDCCMNIVFSSQFKGEREHQVPFLSSCPQSAALLPQEVEGKHSGFLFGRSNR